MVVGEKFVFYEAYEEVGKCRAIPLRTNISGRTSKNFTSNERKSLLIGKISTAVSDLHWSSFYADRNSWNNRRKLIDISWWRL